MILFKNIFIIFLVLFSVFFYIYYKKTNNTFCKNILYYSFGIYISIVIGITLFPLLIQREEIEISIEYNLGQVNNYIPLLNTYKNLVLGYNHGLIFQSLKQIIGNILIFIPLDIYIPFLFKNTNLKKIITFGLFSSLTIELSKLIISTIINYNYRSFDIDDLILNTLGTVLGYSLYKIISKKSDKCNKL